MKAQFLHFHPYLFLHIALWHMSSPIMLFFHSLSFSHLFTEFIAIVFLHIIHFLNLFRRKKFPELIIILLTNIQYLSTLRETCLDSLLHFSICRKRFGGLFICSRSICNISTGSHMTSSPHFFHVLFIHRNKFSSRCVIQCQSFYNLIALYFQLSLIHI